MLIVAGELRPIERIVRRTGNGLNVGSYGDVEFGVTWATLRGQQVHVAGQRWARPRRFA